MTPSFFISWGGFFSKESLNISLFRKKGLIRVRKEFYSAFQSFHFMLFVIPSKHASRSWRPFLWSGPLFYSSRFLSFRFFHSFSSRLPLALFLGVVFVCSGSLRSFAAACFRDDRRGDFWRGRMEMTRKKKRSEIENELDLIELRRMLDEFSFVIAKWSSARGIRCSNSFFKSFW